MKVKITIKVNLTDAKVVEALMRSTTPDNIGLPKGIRIEGLVKGNEATYVIKCEISEPKDVLKCRNTADDLLAHMELVLKTIRSLSH